MPQIIDPTTGLPVEVNPSMGFPTPPAPAQPGLLGKFAGAFGGPQGLLNLGANLMAAGGPSPVRQSFGSALGAGILGNQQFQHQQGQDMLAQMLLQTKIAQAKKGDKQPSDVRSYEFAKANGYTGTFEDWKRIASAQAQTPAAIQEWEAFKKLTPAEQQQWIDFKRNSQPYQVVDIGGGRQLLNKSTGTLAGVTTAEQEAAGAGQVAQAQATGRTTGETTTAAKFDLPRVEDNAKIMFGLLDRLKTHPGRAAATGASSAIPIDRLPGTDARDFVSLLSRVGGQQFLEAYNTLKGGGQITEVEGKKAETAISTIQDRGQSEGAYLQAIEDLREVVNLGLERARKKTQQPSAEATPTRVRKYNPATGKIE